MDSAITGTVCPKCKSSKVEYGVIIDSNPPVQYITCEDCHYDGPGEIEKINVSELVDYLKFALSFAPKEQPEDVPQGLSPMFYLTTSYEGDLKIAEKLKEIRTKLRIFTKEAQ